MNLETLLGKLTNHSIDFSLGDYEDTVLVEKDDEEYFDIKEIYWLSNKRVVFRVEQKENEIQRYKNQPKI